MKQGKVKKERVIYCDNPYCINVKDGKCIANQIGLVYDMFSAKWQCTSYKFNFNDRRR